MQKFLITYPDGTTKEVSAVLHQGVLCNPRSMPDGYEFYRKRTNPDSFDDDEPEYETKRRQKYKQVFIPIFNGRALDADGKLAQAVKMARKNSFADYRGWEKYFLSLGENIGRVTITETK